MNWYKENRWLGNFLVAIALALLIAVWFLFYAKGAFADAMTEFNAAATERSRLEHLTPFPNEANVKKTQLELENYAVRLNALKAELNAQVLATRPMAPNEFQTLLRQTIANTTEKARTNRVKLPDNFHLGFDEFASSLPATTDAPLLGQELQQLELLIGILIDAKVDSIAALKREPTAAVAAAAATPVAKGPAAAKPVIERSIVDLTFAASPSALRKVLNQIAGSDRQFFISRTIYVRSEQVKPPSREQSSPAAPAAATTSPAALKFIVGNEHVETTARIELLRFTF
ncbi:MAG TPA: Amuc_1100 family pilus-like protein [Chthoniobacterales bacterium]|nr:Amuc_1100 family pilus-like protein [Chthoniobacterales bacterium]